MSDIIIIAILVLAAAWALSACLRKKGCSGCGGDCSGCCGSCGRRSDKK